MALRDWLAAGRRRQMVAEDRAGYKAHPVDAQEFAGLIATQVIESDRQDDDQGGSGPGW